MPNLSLTSRAATTFSKTGELDEQAFRAHMQRYVDSGIGVYLASGGSGEGHALTWEELDRVYRLGVEVCGGSVLVGSNQPETHTAKGAIMHAQLAVDAGVDIVQLYGPAAWHGFRPTDAEMLMYFDRVLSEIKYPVALSPNSTLGYTPSPAVIAEVCQRYGQVSTVNLTGISGDTYFMNLRNRLTRHIDINVTYTGSLNMLAMGADGVHDASGEANFLPKTFRRYLDLYEACMIDELSAPYTDIKRVAQAVEPWRPAAPRWIKMAMKVFKLPGGGGGVREPYLMPDDAEIQKFTAALMVLRVSEVEEMALAAGVELPR